MIIWNKLKNKITKIFKTSNKMQIEETLQKIIETKPKQLKKENININSGSFFKEEIKKETKKTSKQQKTFDIDLQFKVPQEMDLKEEKQRAINKLSKIKKDLDDIDEMCDIHNQNDIDFAKTYIGYLIIDLYEEIKKFYLGESIRDKYKTIYHQCKKNLENLECYESFYKEREESKRIRLQQLQ